MDNLSVSEPTFQVNNLTAASFAAGVSPFADAVEAARAAERAGLVAIRVNGKVPRDAGWQQAIVGQYTHKIRRGENIGIAAGTNSGNLVQVEIDGAELYELFTAQFPDLADTLTVKSGGGNGYHVYLRVDDLPKTLVAKLPGEHREIRLKANGQQCVFPPSIHPETGRRYTFHKFAAITHVRDLQAVIDWLTTLGATVEQQGSKPRQRKERTERPNTRPVSNAYDRPKNRRLIDDVAERVSMEAGAYRHTDNRGDEWIEFNDPRRGEKHHSIGFNISKGFFWNFYTEQAEPLYQWCQYYGIDINRYPGGLYEPDTLPVEPTAPAPEAVPVEAAEPRYWAGGLPDAVRATLRQYHKPTLAPFAECVHELVRSGQLDPDAITVNAVIERAAALGFTFAERTARELLKTSGLFRQNPDIEKRHLDTMSDFCRNSTGRPAMTYALLTPSEIKQELLARARFRIFEQTHESDGGLILAQPTAPMMESTGLAGDDSRTVAKTLGDYLQPAFEKQDRAERRAAQRALQTYQALQFDLENDHSTPLPTGWKYDTPKDYAAAHARALVAGTEDSTLSYREMSARLGVERSAVPLVLRRAGIENEQRTERHALSPGQDVERQIRRHAVEAKGYPARLIVQHADGKEGAFDYANADPDTARAFVRNCWAKGASVSVELRVASRQRIVTDGQPERKPAEPTEQKPAAPVTRENAEPAHYEASYSPAWLRRQYRKAMELMNWRKADDGRFVTPDGAPVEPDASAGELLALLLEQAGADRRLIDRLTGRENLADDPLFEAALELGGVVYRITEQGKERVL